MNVAIAGEIQSYGVLLAIDAQHVVRLCSDNHEAHLGLALRLDEPLPPCDLMGAVATASAEPETMQTVSLAGALYDMTTRQRGGLVVLELEPRSEATSVDTLVIAARRAIRRLQPEQRLDTLMSSLSNELAGMTRFEHVEVRRCHADEPERPRLIANIDDVTVPVRAAGDAGVVLNDALLAAAPRDYLASLRAANVVAAMTLPIVVDNQRWGDVVFHHSQPRRLSVAMRAAVEIVIEAAATSIAKLQTIEAATLHEQLLRVQSALARQVAAGGDLLALLGQDAPLLRDVIAADGIVMTFAGQASRHEATPDEGTLQVLLAWLRGTTLGTVFATDDVATLDAGFAIEGVSGLLVAPYAREQDGYLIWFRRAGAWTDLERAAAERIGSELRLVALGQQRMRATAMAQTNAELDRVTYVVSHDLRAPLRAISSLTEFIEEDLRAGKAEEPFKHLATLRARIVRLDDLIQGILRYSRAGQRRHTPVAVDVGLLLRETIDLLGAPEGVSIELIGTFPMLHTGFAPLRQVFSSLLANAVTYGTIDGQGHIEVSARDRGSMWQFTVADHGAGIGSEHFERIFELFSRVSVDSGGTGIGLATVRRTVESYGGRAWVESVLGQGAHFHFTWPKDVPA